MMGASLVARVYTSWSHLPDRPFRLLAHMALTIKDATAQPTYWGGREAMCQSLGLPTENESSHQMVKRAIRKLIDEGAVKRVMDGHAGKRSEYLLTLERGNRSDPHRGNSDDPQRGNSSDPHRGYSDDPAGGTQMTPLGTTKGGTEENKEDGKSPSKVKSPSARVEKRKASASHLQALRDRADREAS